VVAVDVVGKIHIAVPYLTLAGSKAYAKPNSWIRPLMAKVILQIIEHMTECLGFFLGHYVTSPLYRLGVCRRIGVSLCLCRLLVVVSYVHYSATISNDSSYSTSTQSPLNII
jgi:hypothetical protein